MSSIGPIFVLIILLALYFIPALVAYSRSLANTSSIFIVNLFLGWSLIGWVVALAWAVAGTAAASDH
jgi:hypothetical protein